MLKKIASCLCKYKVFICFNRLLKELFHITRYKSLVKYYKKQSKHFNYFYDERSTIDNFKKRTKKNCKLTTINPNKKPRVFWIGADKNQDESGFLQALKGIANVVEFYDYNGNYGQSACQFGFDKKKFEEFLLQSFVLENEKLPIDLILGQMWAKYITKNFIEEVHKYNVPVVNISMDDRLPELWRYKNGERRGSIGLTPQLDMVLTTSSEVCSWYEIEGSPSIFWPLASSAEIFSPNEKQNRDIDVLFIGNKYGAREKIVRKIIDSGIDIHCYGHGWSNGFANFELSAELFKRAKIILGVGTVGHCRSFYTMKLRDFDAPMSGALYLTHRNTDLAKFFIEGQDIECYQTPEEAVKKIRYYLSNYQELEKVARSGHKKALKEHTWKYRLEMLFARLEIS